MKEKKSRISWYCILSVLLICNIIRLFQTSVWADECFTIQLVHNNFTGIVVGTMKDVHPPLYYLITKVFCMIGGYTLPVFRLSSLTPVVILAIYGEKWLCNRYNVTTGRVFCIITMFAPAMYYDIDIRMYSWALLFVTLFTFSILDFYESGEKKPLVMSLIFGVLAAYTHYFALIVVASLYFAVIILILSHKKKQRILKIFGIIAVSCATYLPWISAVISQTVGATSGYLNINSVLYYIKPVLGYVCIIFGTLRTSTDLTWYEALLTVMLLMVVTALTVHYFAENKKKDSFLISLIVLFVIGFSISYIAGCIMDILSHKFVARYLYPTAGILFIILSVIISAELEQYGKNIRNTFSTILIVLLVVDYGITVHTEFITMQQEKTMQEYVYQNVGKDDVVLTDSRLYNWIVLNYNFPELKYTFCENEDQLDQQYEKYAKEKIQVWFLHSDLDGSIYKEDTSWKEVLKAQLGENKCELYKNADIQAN